MFFLQVVKIRLKLIFNKYNLLTICFFSLLFGLFISFYQENEKGLKVGFLSSSDYGDYIINNFEFYNKDLLVAKKYNDESKMKKDLVSGHIDSGYVLPYEFNNTSNVFKEYISDKSMLSEFNKVFLNTIYMQNLAGNFGQIVINNVDNIDKIETVKNINDYNDKYLEDAPFMTYEFVSKNNFYKNNEDNVIATDKMYLQLTGLLVLISTMIILSMDRESFSISLINKLGKKSNQFYFLLGNFIAYFIYVFINLTLLSLWIKEINFLYILFSSYLITLTSFFIYNIFNNKNYFIVFTVFYFLFSIILGEIFFNIDSIFVNIGWLRYFFVTYYLKNILNNTYLFYSFMILFLNLGVTYLVTSNLNWTND